MADDRVTQADLDDLLRITAESATAFIRGDMRRYLELIHHSDDYTLMPPTGGPTRHGSDTSRETVEALEEFFAGDGDGDFELEQSYASGDIAVLVGVERQHGTVAGLQQDWSLRVTLVFRRETSGWRLAHRHADALVHPIDMEHLSRLARGAVATG